MTVLYNVLYPRKNTFQMLLTMPIILKVPLYENTPAAAEATSIALPVAAY
jgi:hypothetical protein